jgi:hypothetical protein
MMKYDDLLGNITKDHTRTYASNGKRSFGKHLQGYIIISIYILYTNIYYTIIQHTRRQSENGKTKNEVFSYV